ncbi:MAG TPA: riboflavin synthase [Spirochaetota bacterium]|nr:riboflavin synthase [Spirochaetota bacterium]
MFTGLIEETGSVAGLRSSGEGKLLTVNASAVLEGTRIGDSISINGACQTVTEMQPGSFTVFVSRVTLDVTTLGSFKQGLTVNLERALTLTTRLGGHIVQGHVDFTGRILSVKKDSMGVEIDVAVDPAKMKHIVKKGSIAADGISLTVVETGDSWFRLYLIPETLDKTNIGLWKTGTIINVETDILAKYIEKMLVFGKSGFEDDSRTSSDAGIMAKLTEGGYL